MYHLTAWLTYIHTSEPQTPREVILYVMNHTVLREGRREALVGHSEHTHTHTHTMASCRQHIFSSGVACLSRVSRCASVVR